MRWQSLILVSLVCACSSSGTKNGGSGAAAGTGGFGNSGGGGSAGTGATAGSGGSGGSAGGVSVSGSLSVPSDQSVDGVQVIACVPNAAGTDCDTAKSQVATLSGSGTTADFDVAGLVAEPCYVIAVKDNNQNGSVDAGDLLGAAVDKDGSLLLVTPPVANLTLTLALVPPQTGTVPAELVGTWQSISSDVGSNWTFNADGSWSSMYIYDPTSCVVIDKVAIARDGYVDVQGNLASFNPQSGSYQSTDCSGTVTQKPPNLQPFAYQYSIAPDGSGNTILTLTDPQDPTSTTNYTKQ